MPNTVHDQITRGDCRWGFYLDGRKARLIDRGLADADWFRDGTERDEIGRVVRLMRLEIEGLTIETTTPAHGPCHMRVFFPALRWSDTGEAWRAFTALRLRRNDAFQRFMQRALQGGELLGRGGKHDTH